MYAGRKGENRGAVTEGREGGRGDEEAEQALWAAPGPFSPKLSEWFRGEDVVWMLHGRGIKRYRNPT